MELGEYPFSERYGWIRDKYGVTWQLMLAPQAAKIVPSLLFVGAQYRKAEEAMRLYTSQFKDSQVNSIERYDPGQGEAEDAVMYGSFTLAVRSSLPWIAVWSTPSPSQKPYRSWSLAKMRTK